MNSQKNILCNNSHHDVAKNVVFTIKIEMSKTLFFFYMSNKLVVVNLLFAMPVFVMNIISELIKIIEVYVIYSCATNLFKADIRDKREDH